MPPASATSSKHGFSSSQLQELSQSEASLSSPSSSAAAESAQASSQRQALPDEMNVSRKQQGQPEKCSMQTVFDEPGKSSVRTVFDEPGKSSLQTVFDEPEKSSVRTVFGEPEKSSVRTTVFDEPGKSSVRTVFDEPEKSSVQTVFDEPEKSSVWTVFHELERSSLQTVFEELCDPLLPVRGHALIALAKLVEEKDAETLGKKEVVQKVFEENLRHGDSYLYLAAVNGLSALADRFPDSVVPCLAAEFAGLTNSKTSAASSTAEHRLKVGEALMKATRSLGEW